ncbi:MAG TPA: hypothetical protein PLV25_06070, partial [Opitutales bacterium]|nr:hypothetical protein [Opitutales bacterium]
YKEEIMTIAQCLEEKGLQRGRQEGHQEGRQEGLELGKMATAKQLFSLGLTHEIISQATGFSAEKLNWILANEIL